MVPRIQRSRSNDSTDQSNIRACRISDHYIDSIGSREYGEFILTCLSGVGADDVQLRVFLYYNTEIRNRLDQSAGEPVRPACFRNHVYEQNLHNVSSAMDDVSELSPVCFNQALSDVLTLSTFLNLLKQYFNSS